MILEDICTHVVDCAHKTAPITESGGYYAVGTPAMRGNVINYDEARPINHNTFTAWTTRLRPKYGDLLLAREAPVGPVVPIPPEENVAPGQRTVLLRPDRSVVAPLFLYYYLTSPARQADLLVKASGSTVPHLNVADVRTFPTPGIPSLVEQRAIADTLGALDDKIAANGRTLARLGELAVAIYESHLTRGLTEVPLDRVAEFRNRQRIPLSSRERQSRAGTVPYYGAAGPLDFVDEAIFNDPLVLVGEDGSVIRPDGRPVVQYVWGPAWVNNHAHVLTGRGISTELLRIAVQRSNVTHLVTGAVQPKISMGNLKTLHLQLPVDNHRIDEVAQSFAALHRALSSENGALEQMRDELLPLLMSGKVRVREAEKVVEGVV